MKTKNTPSHYDEIANNYAIWQEQINPKNTGKLIALVWIFTLIFFLSFMLIGYLSQIEIPQKTIIILVISGIFIGILLSAKIYMSRNKKQTDFLLS